MVMIEYFFRFKIQLHSHAGWLVGGHSQLQKSSDLHYRKKSYCGPKLYYSYKFDHKYFTQ